MLAAILVFFAQELSRSTPQSERGWPLGFRVVEVSELPRGTWFSTWQYECIPAVWGDASGLEIDLGGHVGRNGVGVHLRLDPTGVMAQARESSCPLARPPGLVEGHHLAGTSCLVTDGQSAVLEFEIYDGDSGGGIPGRVELGRAGAELAKRVRTPPEPDTLHHQRVEFERHERRFEASGGVDAFGRRQGLWTVRESGKGPTLEMSWRDGIPDGVYRLQERGLEVGTFQAGFREGQSMLWRQSGERTVREWHEGQPTRTTDYAPDGRKLTERGHEVYRDALWEKVTALHTRR